jgi:hypothetical protein
VIEALKKPKLYKTIEINDPSPIKIWTSSSVAYSQIGFGFVIDSPAHCFPFRDSNIASLSGAEVRAALHALYTIDPKRSAVITIRNQTAHYLCCNAQSFSRHHLNSLCDRIIIASLANLLTKRDKHKARTSFKFTPNNEDPESLLARDYARKGRNLIYTLDEDLPPNFTCLRIDGNLVDNQFGKHISITLQNRRISEWKKKSSGEFLTLSDTVDFYVANKTMKAFNKRNLNVARGLRSGSFISSLCIRNQRDRADVVTCPFCKLCKENAQHLLIDCLYYEDIRQNTYDKILAKIKEHFGLEIETENFPSWFSNRNQVDFNDIHQHKLGTSNKLNGARGLPPKTLTYFLKIHSQHAQKIAIEMNEIVIEGSIKIINRRKDPDGNIDPSNKKQSP